MRNLYRFFIVLMVLLTGIVPTVNSQSLSSYSLVQSSATYTSISGTSAGISGNDATSAALSIGFNFTYCGTVYTQVKLCTNGWMQMGGITTSVASNNDLASTSYANFICPYWDDMNAAATSDIKYTTTGTAPYRLFTAQWGPNVYPVSGGSTHTYNFQIKLYETSNAVQFCYGAINIYSGSTGSIGLVDQTGGSGHFISVSPGSPATTSMTAANNSIASFSYSNLVYTFNPPLCGTYSINSSLSASTTNFVSFASAKTALETFGVSCPVTFNVAAGTYNEQLSWGNTAIPNISSTNTVIFQAANGDSSSVIIQANNTPSTNYVFQMNGAQYLIWKKLTFKSLSGYYGTAINVSGTTQNIQFQQCRFTGIALAASGGTEQVIVYKTGVANNSMTFNGCRFENGSWGIYWVANTPLPYETGTVISNNIFINQTYYGIYLTYLDGSTVTGNTITASSSTATSYYGIEEDNNQNNSVIAGNKIIIPSTTTYGHGMYRLNCTGTVSAPGMIYNNFISDASAYPGTIGNTTSPYSNFYFNSINNTTTNPANYALNVYNCSGTVDIKNNIIATQGSYVIVATGNTLLTSDYNDLYNSNSEGTWFIWGSYQLFFTNWRTLSGQDTHSVSVDPGFTSTTDLHTSLAAFYDTGTPITGITTDIDGDTRNSTAPCIGADEFTPPPMAFLSTTANQASTGTVSPGAADAQILRLDVTMNSISLNPLTLTGFTFNTSGSTSAADIAGAKVYYTGTSSTFDQTSQFGSTVVNPSGSFSFTGSQLLQPNTNYFWLVYNISTTATIGNVVDAVYNSVVIAGVSHTPTVSDPAGNRTIAAVPLCGTYTINPSLPASSVNFVSFAAAKSALQNYGVSCPVIFNVAAGTYTEQHIWGDIAIPNISATNTVTFQAANGDSSSVTIQANNSIYNNFVIQLSGAQYLIWKNLTFKAVDATNSNGTVINVTGTTHDIQFQHCRLVGLAVTGSTSYNLTIVFKDAVLNNSITINACRLENGSYGIRWFGATSSPYETGTVISNNIFTNQTYYGMYLQYEDSPVITGNSITASTSSADYYYGIMMYNNYNNSVIAGNKIIIPGNVNNGIGIYRHDCPGTASAQALIYNNFISNASLYPGSITSSSSTYTNFYFNSINCTSTNTANPGYGLNFDNTSGTIDIKNNIIVTHGSYVIEAYSFTGITSDYNDFYTSQTVNFSIWSWAQSNLAGWQAASGLDAHSLSINPNFFSATDLHTSLAALDNAGTPIAGITTDIDGDARSTIAPCIGADEFGSGTFSVTGNKTNNICFGACAGSIDITVSGGTTPYYYIWSNGPTTQDLTGLCAGTYTVTVSDSGGSSGSP
ncbi:MAG: right-handed parallel beta-helix repeat-containing protein, partial [Bacteroidia bacterium]|nr:right-handed parallel beta-helix repeat-containing protein [Bacteroidia bacterium]